jgi:transcriptional regulator with XRE-family HTH domain
MFDRLGETLTVLRLLRRLSQAQLAERAGIRSNQISRYETGQVLPQLAQLERILTALDVGMPELLFTLEHLERTARVLEDADRLPAEAILVRDAVMAYWTDVTDLHLRISRQVAKVVSENLGWSGEPGSRGRAQEGSSTTSGSTTP